MPSLACTGEGTKGGCYNSSLQTAVYGPFSSPWSLSKGSRKGKI